MAVDPAAGDESIGKLGQRRESNSERACQLGGRSILSRQRTKRKKLGSRNRLAPWLDGDFGSKNASDGGQEIE